MKRFLILTLALVLTALPFMPVAKASSTESIKYHAAKNNTASHAATQIAVTTIVPGKHRILGFSVCPNVSGSGTAIAGLYDASTAGQMATTTLLGEEGGVNTTTHSRIFPGPIPLSNGLRVMQGNATTVVIWYEETIH